jgi:hypothetical protein
MRWFLVALCLIASELPSYADTFFYHNGSYTIGGPTYYTNPLNNTNFPAPPDFPGLTNIRNVHFTGSNTLGQFVGTFDQGTCNCFGTSKAFFYDGTSYSLLGFGSLWTIPYAINDLGQVVGIVDQGGGAGFSGFFFQSGQFISLGTKYYPELVNNQGAFVGYGGFFSSSGVYVDLDPPGFDHRGYVRVTGLDDGGGVYGYFINGLELAAIDGDARREQTHLAAEFDEARTYLAQRQAIVFAEVRDRLVIRCEPTQQPHTSILRPASRSSRRLD